MVYFTYSQVAFVTLLAFAATISGEPMDAAEIENRIKNIEKKLKNDVTDLKNSEARLQSLTDKILSQNASLRGELEKYTDCVKTAYKYKWGAITYKEIAGYLDLIDDGTLDNVIDCCLQEESTYLEKQKAFPVNKCHGNLASANQEDLQQLKLEIEALYFSNSWYSSEIFYENIYTIKLKMLTGK
ncbi:unnamed protein product [Trichobilharzia szidati]|nr:unnamed protein product [Trichobilharzia szidati]